MSHFIFIIGIGLCILSLLPVIMKSGVAVFRLTAYNEQEKESKHVKTLFASAVTVAFVLCISLVVTFI